jgi:K+/H+ antiporter YhaU regulatory subunit KhtT
MTEPIAWMHTNSGKIFKTEKPNQFDLPLFTPLYAHPQKELIQQQENEIKQLKFLLKNLILATNKKMEELEKELNDCTCQGGHSEAYLKAKGRKITND